MCISGMSLFEQRRRVAEFVKNRPDATNNDLKKALYAWDWIPWPICEYFFKLTTPKS